jgi:glycosyltransferase involved in cell wall biosynthesis
MVETQRFRILMVSALCPPDFDGGYELRAFQIAQALRRAGHHVSFVTSHFRSSFSGKRLDEPWVYRILHHVPVSRSKTLWRYIDRIPLRIACTRIAEQNIPALRSHLTQHTYDVAYCFGLERVSLATMIAAMEKAIPILWHAGDGYIANQVRDSWSQFPGMRSALLVFARKWHRLEREVDYENIAFVSNFLRKECETKRLTPRNALIISRGFEGELGRDVERPRATPSTFLMACRVERNKGVHVAVAAASLLRKRRPELAWKFDIAGVSWSGYVDEIQRQIARNGLSDRVRLLGHQPHSEVLKMMRAASAFMSCATYGEPFGGTIIEALGVGTPLIGSNKGSILEVIEPDVCGLIYECDDAEALSRHMETILVDRATANRLARNGIRVVEERYTLDAIIRQTERALTDVFDASRRQSAALRHDHARNDASEATLR